MKKHYVIFLLLLAVVLVGTFVALRTNEVPTVADRVDEVPATTADGENAPLTIKVISATYGSNCPKVITKKADVTSHLAQACDGKASCEYTVRVGLIGDPAVACRKGYVAEWSCGTDSTPMKATASPEASGKKITLKCGQ